MSRRKSGKRIWLYFGHLLILWAALPAGWTSEAAASEKLRLSMGGSNTGTWIYMFCATLTDTWKRYIPGLDITVLATAGSTANYIPLDKGEMDLGAGSTTGDFHALNAMYFTKTKLQNFCVMLPATKGFYQTFTYADSPIKSMKDLDGKKVQVGARASPSSISSEDICTALGIKPKYIYSTPSEAADMVKDRRVDAMIYGVGAPWSVIMDIATNRKLKFIPMTPQEQKKVFEYRPFLIPEVVPAKTYSFQTEDLPLVASFQTVNVRSGLSEEVVYLLTKTAWMHWDEIIKASTPAKWVKPGDMLKMLAPIHPGAVKYYQEIGIQIPEGLIWKKK